MPESYLPSLPTSCENMASHRERIMEKRRKSQIVYAGPTNLYQHSTTDLARGIMTNERKQSGLSKARSFKHSKTTSSFFELWLGKPSVPTRPVALSGPTRPARPLAKWRAWLAGLYRPSRGVVSNLRARL